MNAGGVPNTCKSSAGSRQRPFGDNVCGTSGGRVSNTWATYLQDWDNPGKPGLIPDDDVNRMIHV